MGKQCSSSGLRGMRASGYSSRSSLYRGLFENGGKSPEQGAECEDEAHPCIELGIARQPLFQSRHADQHHTEVAMVKNVAYLFQTRGLEAISLIDDDQRSGIRSVCTLLSVGSGKIGRRCCRRRIYLDDLPLVPRRRLDPFRRQEGLSLPFGLLLSSLLPQPGFDRERPQLMTFDLDILCDAPWRMNDFRRIEDGRAPGDGGQCCRRSHRV